MIRAEKVFGFIFVSIFLTLLFVASHANAQPFYTGLIIDARGLGVLPSMSPKIYDNNGNEVYGTMNVDPDFVIEKGIASYSDTVEGAISEGVVGEHPLVVKAVSLADDPFGGSLVVKSHDAQNITSANEKAAFLSAYRVAIIM